MRATITKSLIKSGLLLGIATTMMGNQSCEQQPETRELRRRVQMGRVVAPSVPLPTEQFNGQKFDFAFAANTQMAMVLQNTRTFSTATIDPDERYTPEGLSREGEEKFYQCGDDEGFQEFNLFTNSKEFSKLGGDISKNASCLIGSPNGIVSAAVVDFSFKTGGGVNVNLRKLPVNAFNFEVETYELRMTMDARTAYDRSNHRLAAIAHDEKATKGQVGAGLDLGSFGLGFKYYYSSPLGKLVDKALRNSVEKLKDQWDQDPGNAWYSTVLRNCDKYVYIDAGGDSDVGLKVGDIVAIKNVKYFWSGRRCESHLDSEIAQETVAYAVVKGIGRNLAEAWLIEDDPKYPHNLRTEKIFPGARVYMHQFVEQVNAEKKRQK